MLRNPMQMGPTGRKVFGKSGCAKEQKKQYANYVNDQARTNSHLRQQILEKSAQQRPPVNRETPKSLLKADGRGGSKGVAAQHMPMSKPQDNGNANANHASGYKVVDFPPQGPGTSMTGRSKASKGAKSKASSHNVSITLPSQQHESQTKQLPPLKTNPSDISSLISEGSSRLKAQQQH